MYLLVTYRQIASELVFGADKSQSNGLPVDARRFKSVEPSEQEFEVGCISTHTCSFMIENFILSLIIILKSIFLSFLGSIK